MRGTPPAISTVITALAILTSVCLLLNLSCNENISDTGKTNQDFFCLSDEADNMEDFIHTSKNGEVKITGYTGSANHLTIPGMIENMPVTEIGDNAFLGNEGMMSVFIPETVDTIGNSSFKNCINLSKIVIPDSVKGIGISVFENCQKLENVILGSGMKNIGGSAFKGCESLKILQFKGNAPDVGNKWISDTSDDLIIYYVEGKTKFDTSKWKGLNTVPLSTPGSPTHPSAIPGESLIDFSWQMPDDIETETILGFEIFYKKTEDTEWTALSVMERFDVRIENLCNGIEYEICVSAVNIAGSGDPSEIVIAMPFTVPEAPVLEVVVGDSEIILTWNVPNNMGSAITEYSIYRDNVKIVSLDCGYTEYIIENPEKDVLYTFCVSASNHVGESLKSNTVEVMLEKTYTISFDANNGTSAESVLLKEGEKVIPPSDPQKEGCFFTGWDSVIPEFMPAYDVIVYAVWHTVTVIPDSVCDLYYNGENQAGIPAGEGYDLSGDYSMKDAGDYVVFLTLKDGFVWADGTYGIKEVNWSIDQKTVYVYPEKDQSKLYFEEDPELEYILSEDLEVLGKLNRSFGENLGSYEIDIGSLSIDDNNYRLEMGEEKVCFTIVAACPGAPTDLEAVLDEGRVRLQWCSPEFDGGCDISCYEVWTITDDGVLTLHGTVENQESYDTPVDSGAVCGFAIKAVNSAGASDFSEVVSVEIGSVPEHENDEHAEYENHEVSGMVFTASFILVVLLGMALIIMNRFK